MAANAKRLAEYFQSESVRVNHGAVPVKVWVQPRGHAEP